MKMPRFCFSALVLLVFSAQVAAQSTQWESPESVPGAQTIGLDQAVALHKQGVVFIDVRSSKQFYRWHIPAARHLYVNESFNEGNLLKYLGDKKSPLVIYCNGIKCSLSSKAAQLAVAWGFTQVHYFRAGVRAWRLSGNPLEYGPQR